MMSGPNSKLKEGEKRARLLRMTRIAEKLDNKLGTWSPQTAAQVEQMVSDIIELADADALDILPARPVVQEVLDLIDESIAR